MPLVSGRSAAYGDLIAQYLRLRDEHPGTILLFRVGSFYEILFEDAEVVARELGLKLSERPSGGSAQPVPQCGFAHHALDSFLPRLLRASYRVAVCEEAEEEGSAIRGRSVVRTLTPGTVTDPRLLREDQPTYLAAVVTMPDRLGLAWTDVAAGEFKAGEFTHEEAAAELQRLDPAELLVPSDRTAPAPLIARRNVTPVGPSADAEAVLRRAFPAEPLADLPVARAAAGLIVGYLEATQGDALPALDPPDEAASGDSVRLDAATQRHLELVETERSRERAGSLLAVLDRTVTPMGRRMLRAWLLRPLNHAGKLSVRQRIVAELVESPRLRDGLSQHLATFADIERLAVRVASRRATVDDLAAFAAAATALPRLADATAAAHSPFLRSLGAPRPLLTEYGQTAAAVLPSSGEGSVRPDASPTLKRAAEQVAKGTAWRERYVEELRRQPGLAKLKLERTATQGLFLELPVNSPVPPDWIRRGGLQKVERYSTAALEQHAIELAQAEEAVARETGAVIDALRAVAASAAGQARDLARHLAAADALLSLAIVADDRGWVSPVVDGSGCIEIVGGRHPVVELLGPFHPNDTRLLAHAPTDQLVVLTGPNMAGKSTWMRQIALITILAQVGSFVPAERAHIGMVDAVFTRIGAVDDLAAGRSTFLVEMLETAAVLEGVTDRSLVLLDEIGRGTSTHDGMAIAWAVIEQLATGPARPRAVVATHYHELAALHTVHPQITLLRAAVDERPDGVVFTHRIEPGAADRSFGIEVARLAGLPASVIERARRVADVVEPLSEEIARRLGDAARLEQRPGAMQRRSPPTTPRR